MEKSDMARFDTRLPREQKEFFEYAANLGGFRSLTEFIIQAVQEFANKIVEENQKILASQKDREIFFDALMNHPAPNSELKQATKRFQELLK
jgi:uncharacterized protein (DUF1778 family)